MKLAFLSILLQELYTHVTGYSRLSIDNIANHSDSYYTRSPSFPSICTMFYPNWLNDQKDD